MARRSKSRGVLTLVIAVIVLAVGSQLASNALERVFAPWAFEGAGRPALVGTWVGDLTTQTGKRRGVLLALELPPGTGRYGRRSWRGSPNGTLGGTLRSCDERGAMVDYTVDGKPDSRRATKLHFHARPNPDPGPDGLTFSWFKGGWDGADRVDLSVQTFWRKGASAISGFSYPDTESEPKLQLRRGGASEFAALCGRLKGG